MKRLLALLLAAATLAVLPACASSKNTSSDTSSSSGEEYIPYNYDLTKYITLGEYKGIPYTPLPTEPTEDDIWARIVETLQECKLYNKEVYPDLFERDITAGDVRYGDIVLLNIRTVSGANEVDAATGGNLATEIGGNFFTANITAAEAESAGFSYEFLTQFLTDIEKEAVGKTIGTAFSMKGTFPDDNFDTSLAGKAYEMQITVTKVGKRYGHPEHLSSEELSLLGGYEDEKTCFDAIKATLEENGFDTAEGEIWHYIAYGFRYLGYYNTTLYDGYYRENLTAGTVQNGDTVYISFEGRVDGKVLDTACSDGNTLVIGSGNYIDGFESGLIGKEIGSTVTLDLHFPNPYETNPDLSGKAVTFKVTIHLVTKRYDHPDVLPDTIMTELYEEGLASSTEFADLWEQMRAEEAAQLISEAEADKEMQIVEQIKENTILIALPQEEIDRSVRNMEEQFAQMATYYGYESLELFLSAAYGATYDEFLERAKMAAEDEVFTTMIVYQVIRLEGLDKMDESFYEEKAQPYVEEAGEPDYATLCADYGYYRIRELVYNDLFAELVTESAVAVEE